MNSETTALKEFMITNGIDTFFVNDDPDGVSGDQGIFFDCDHPDFESLIYSDDDDSLWDNFLHSVFDALGVLVAKHPYARLAGSFVLVDGELTFRQKLQYFQS
jgi:hypothetical protein